MPERGAAPGVNRVWTWQSGPEPLDLVAGERPLPDLRSGEVLVRNAAIGLNPVDWKVLGNRTDWQPGHVPGVDGAGTVVAAAPDVPAQWLESRVCYHQSLAAHGSFAEHVPIRADVLLGLPNGVSFVQAAGFPCPALTAWLALEKLPHRAGEALLVSGAGGAVGRYLVQLAVRRGWQVTVMSNARHRDTLVRLGAVAWLPGPLPEGAAWNGGRYTAVIDCVGSDHAGRLVPSLRANGHLVCIQGRLEGWPNPPFGRALSLHEVALGALHQHGDASDWARFVTAGETMLEDIASGFRQPEPLVEGSFDELPTLLDTLRHRSFSGKPIIRL